MKLIILGLFGIAFMKSEKFCVTLRNKQKKTYIIYSLIKNLQLHIYDNELKGDV